jgi:hypothetical protein
LLIIFGRTDKLIRNKGMLAARFLEKFEPYPEPETADSALSEFSFH